MITGARFGIFSSNRHYAMVQFQSDPTTGLPANSLQIEGAPLAESPPGQPIQSGGWGKKMSAYRSAFFWVVSAGVENLVQNRLDNFEDFTNGVLSEMALLMIIIGSENVAKWGFGINAISVHRSLPTSLIDIVTTPPESATAPPQPMPLSETSELTENSAKAFVGAFTLIGFGLENMIQNKSYEMSDFACGILANLSVLLSVTLAKQISQFFTPHSSVPIFSPLPILPSIFPMAYSEVQPISSTQEASRPSNTRSWLSNHPVPSAIQCLYFIIGSGIKNMFQNQSTDPEDFSNGSLAGLAVLCVIDLGIKIPDWICQTSHSNSPNSAPVEPEV